MAGKKEKRKLTLKDLLFLLCLLTTAWIFRWQVVQAVNISSSSMEPTLYGNEHGGDMVLLNKLAYKVGEPQRWDVIVFSHPDQGDNYIKRLVGLPGETLQIRNGDLYVDGIIRAKKIAVQQGLWISHYTGSRKDPQPLAKAWKSTGRGSVQIDAASFEVSSLEGSGLCGLATNSRPITDHARPVNLVGDLKVEFDAIALQDNTLVAGDILDNAVAYGFSLPVGSSEPARLLIDRQTVATFLDVHLEVGKRHHVVFEKVDGQMVLRVNGEEIAQHEIDTLGGALVRKTTSSGARIGIRGGQAKIDNVDVYRDIYYTNTDLDGNRHPNGIAQPYKIPNDQYFFMGDNSANSQDSRDWGCVSRDRLIGKAVFIFNRLQSL